MAVEHIFAPKTKPLGPLPDRLPGTTVVPPEWLEFKRGESVSSRNRVVALANGHHVWECEYRDGDSPNRNEEWRGDNAEQGVYFPGQTMATAFGVWLPPDFPVPPAWSVFWQIHTPYDYPTQAPSYASPMTALSGEGGQLRIQNNSEGGIDWATDYARGHWHYFVIEVLFGRPGWLKVWHALDRVPQLVPDDMVVNKSRNTSIPNHSNVTGEYTKHGIYMSPSTGGKIYKMLRDGSAQASNAVRALERYVAEVCNPAMVGAPPPPDPTLTIATNITDQSILKGPRKWNATVSGGTPNEVRFYIDNVLKWTEKTAPYDYGGTPDGVLDTTQLSEGAHVLRVEAGTTKLDRNVTVDNVPDTPPPPVITNKDRVIAAKLELEQTTISGKNWVSGGRKPGHWAEAYKQLDQVKDC